ncbi:MAG: YraN family protein [Gemmataceae bacterium]|nr:YraN family protein [Gemmataceae bacterium]
MKPWWRRWFGTRSERAAEASLRKAGMRVLARNVSLGGGELDLVALDGRTVVFVEVRSTEDADLTRPSESVDARKEEKVGAAALAWLKAKNLLGHDARFDVVLVSWPKGEREPVIEHVRQAFEAAGRWQMWS